MKNSDFIYRISVVLLTAAVVSLLLYFFIPRSVDNGVVVNSSSGNLTVYIDGKLKTYKSSKSFERLTVLNFKHNLFYAYSFKKVNVIKDRVMIKKSKAFELESYGFIDLSSKVNCYIIDKNSNISVSDTKHVIVGADNVKCYADSKDHLKTFIISPLDYSRMRVAVSTTDFKSLLHNSVTISSDNKLKLYSVRENKSVDISAGTNITVEKSGNNLKITSEGKSNIFSDRVYIKGTSMKISSISRGNGSFVPEYKNILEFTVYPKGILIINELNLEDYLKKVVPSEMPSYANLEALKCQAVAARTYAISDMLGNRYSELGFYVDDSTQSQVYNNVEEQESTNEAVDSTKGSIMVYENTPIDAKYYSSSCGLGAAYSDIWFKADGSSDDRPYLTAGNYLLPKGNLPKTENDWYKFFSATDIRAYDSMSPYYRWNMVFPEDAMSKSLKKSLPVLYASNHDYFTIMHGNKENNILPALGNLKDIKVLKRGTSGNVIEISFIFDNVTVNLKEDYNIRSAIRCSADFTGVTIPINRPNASPLLSNNYLLSSFFAIKKSGSNYLIAGGGYGHGVGMSQYGAIALSGAGENYKQILGTYYKNVTLATVY